MLVLNILLTVTFIYLNVKLSNILTNVLEKYITSNVYILISFHLYLICLFYSLFTTYMNFTDNPASILIGPMIGVFSSYFVPFLKMLH